MCSNIRLSRSKNILPGHRATYKTYQGSITLFSEGTWGLQGGMIYNCRLDRINGTKWYNTELKRGIAEIIGFMEGSVEFCVPGYARMYVAVLYNDKKEFAVITEPSTGEVGKIHHRMPVLLDDSEFAITSWLTMGDIIHSDPSLLRKAS